MDNYQVTQGSAITFDVILRDTNGDPITTYLGTESLTTVVWPGGNRAASVIPETRWSEALTGTITLTIASTETLTLTPGRYQILTRLDDGSGPVDAYFATIDVLASSGTGLAPKTIPGVDYNLLQMYGRTWLSQLQTTADEAGFAEQLHRARTWLEDLAHAHYRVSSMVMVVGAQAFGPRRSGARSTWLQDQLDNDTLIVTDQIREAVAKKAMAYICEGQVGLGDQASQYARLGRMYHSQADQIATCLVLSLDTNGDGWPDVNIDCSCTDPMYG